MLIIDYKYNMRLGSGCSCVYLVSEHPLNKKDEIKKYRTSKNTASRYEVNKIVRRFLKGCLWLRGKVDKWDKDVANRVKNNRKGFRLYNAGDLTSKRHAFVLKSIANKGWENCTAKQHLEYFEVEE
jgi:hypothetical protein